MLNKKKRFDEEFFHTIHDRPSVELFTDDEVNEKIQDGMSEQVVNDLMERINDIDHGGDKLIDSIIEAKLRRADILKAIRKSDEKKLWDLIFSEGKEIFLEDKSHKIKFKENILKKINPEKIREIYQVTTSDERFANKKIDEFIKYNRRLTFELCNKIIKLDENIYYCGIAKMPGVWIASSIKESESSRIVNITGKNDKGNDVLYSRQEHLVESCSRQLLRAESDSFLGPCKYSVTFYCRV